MIRTIAFGGHYNLGERLSAVQVETITAARAEGCPVGILIGDIDFNQKVAAYIRTGIEGVKDSYRKRLARNQSGCVRAHIPKEEELNTVIDEEQYDFAAAMLESRIPRLYQEIKRVPLDITESELTGTHHSLAHVLRAEVIVPLTIRRMWAYGLRQADPRPELRLYSERELKNTAAQRIRPSREGADSSWLAVRKSLSPLLRALFDEVKSPNEIPACRGILLALYEGLATEGFEEVSQHYSARDQLAIQNATDLYLALKKNFSDDPRWQLMFKNTFYTEE